MPNRYKNIFRLLTCLAVFAFFSGVVILPQPGSARGGEAVLSMPGPGTMVELGPQYTPPTLKGLRIDPQEPLNLNFVLETGDSDAHPEALKEEADKLIKYFLTSLTIPEEDIWVNLSPYQKDKITTEALSVTDMGRDLLAQDYLLKQLTSSLTHPDTELGRLFWSKVYAKAYELYGTTEIPMNTFNKVWIVPDQVRIYERDNTAYIISSHLKVLLDEDYLGIEQNFKKHSFGTDRLENHQVRDISSFSSSITRDLLIPQIEEEVNEGKNFAAVRQIFNSLILSAWYKMRLKESVLYKIYVDQQKIRGIDIDDKDMTAKIYDEYVSAFQKGVYNLVKEDYDPHTEAELPRKYFSGGIEGDVSKSMTPQDLFPDEVLPDGKALNIEASLSFRLADTAKELNLDLGIVQFGDWEGLKTHVAQAFKNRGVGSNFMVGYDYAEMLAFEADDKVLQQLSFEERVNLFLFSRDHPANARFYNEFFKDLVTERARIFRAIIQNDLDVDEAAEVVDREAAIDAVVKAAFPEADHELAKKEGPLPAAFDQLFVDRANMGRTVLEAFDPKERELEQIYFSAAEEVNVEYFDKILAWDDIFYEEKIIDPSKFPKAASVNKRLLSQAEFTRKVRDRFARLLEDKLRERGMGGVVLLNNIIMATGRAFPFFEQEAIDLGDIILDPVTGKFELKAPESRSSSAQQKGIASSEKDAPEDDLPDAGGTKPDKLGGIDLDITQADMQIEREGTGSAQIAQSFDRFKILEFLPIEGFVPVINEMTAIPSLPIYLGVAGILPVQNPQVTSP